VSGNGNRLRERRADYLFDALDILVDPCFPVLENWVTDRGP